MNVRHRRIAPVEGDWTSLVGYGVMLGLSWVLVAFSTARALQPGPNVFAQAVSVAIPTVFAITLFVGGLALFFHGLFGQAFRIARWTVIGTTAVLLAVVVNGIWISAVDFGFDAALATLVNAAISGAILGFLVGIYDAHKTRLKQDLAAKSERTAELSQRLSVINRVLRHDLRHQTQLIQGYADRLREGAIETQTGATRIQRANDRLLDLAEQTRKLQELLSGERFGAERVDLVAQANRACETIEARHPDVDFACAMPESQPARATPLIEDVIKELLENAAIHNDSTTPRATLRIEVDGSRSNPVALTVADNGPGLPETEPIREGKSESPLHHSNGFGLWFVTWVLEAGDGDWKISTPDRDAVGTEVTLRFPTPERV